MKRDFYQKYSLIFLLILTNLFIWSYHIENRGRDLLKVYFLDVGQGDSILIEAPNGRQLLIDGGRDSSVLNELGRVMGFFDRSIDIVLATHPDADHVTGLPLVLDRYRVETFIDSIAEAESLPYTALQQKARGEGAEYYVGFRGMVITLDEEAGVYLHVLYPYDDEFRFTDTNDLSIITKLVYGDTSFMLTGDAPKIVETMLTTTDGEYLKSSVLKAGHHGSNTSSGTSFVEMVDPEYVVISAGRDNSYGHPHPEVIETFEEQGAEIHSTIEEGTIEFRSNGFDVWVK